LDSVRVDPAVPADLAATLAVAVVGAIVAVVAVTFREAAGAVVGAADAAVEEADAVSLLAAAAEDLARQLRGGIFPINWRIPFSTPTPFL
jgi:hypothetical protein